jgi:hypothetical protein
MSNQVQEKFQNLDLALIGNCRVAVVGIINAASLMSSSWEEAWPRV